MPPRIFAGIILQSLTNKQYEYVDRIEIDVTDIFVNDAETIKQAITDFDNDCSPYIEYIPSATANALNAVHGGPSEVNLAIRDYLIETLQVLGEEPDEACYDNLDWLTNELLAEVRSSLGISVGPLKPGECRVFNFSNRWHIAQWDQTAWQWVGTYSSEDEMQKALKEI